MDNTNKLPPLPASDPEAIAQNRFHGFYNVGSRDYWKLNEVTLNKLQEPQQCQHYFKNEGYEVRCGRCYIGFMGSGMVAKEGKLFVNNIETVF